MSTAVSEPEYLRVRDVAQKLGVSAFTVRQWINDDKLDALRLPGGWRIHPDDLDKFIRERRHRD